MVAAVNMGAQETGIIDFAWDGQDASGNPLPPGKYRFEAQASIDGEPVQLATLLPANVDSVSLGVGKGGEMVLNLAGLGSIGLSDVFTIGK
ncbi:MAG: flagellar biosynthesis protein FlgD, partial [Gammaproteobacteria bacterium]|nr:flagellar biosynthesis protein FlgD [Gammaproteobacteria bacterium]